MVKLNTNHFQSLNEYVYNILSREFQAGENWAYRNPGINMLFELVSNLTE
ncbi:hypothetical protein YDYSG_05390 [Paenibacillus tyrfis]|nr:hypothetical protein YDYSG_05390 [Paenibacillus tyrfis]